MRKRIGHNHGNYLVGRGTAVGTLSYYQADRAAGSVKVGKTIPSDLPALFSEDEYCFLMKI